MPFPTYDTIDAVPEAFRPEYEEREDPATPGVKKWHPKVPDVTKLQSALESERKAARDADAARKAAEKERDDMRRTREAKEKGISDEELQKIRDAEEAARKPILEEAERLKAENRKLKLDDKARALALKHGVRPESLDRAMRDLAAQGRLDLSTDGSIVVKDLNGNITAETPDTFFEKTYKAEASEFYKGSGANGGGGTQSVTTATSYKGKTPDQIADEMQARRAARPNALAKPAAKVSA